MHCHEAILLCKWQKREQAFCLASAKPKNSKNASLGRVLPGGLPAARNRANGAARVPVDHGRPLLELARLALAVALSRSAPQLGSGGALSRRGAGSTLPTAAQPGSAWRAARAQAANKCVREGVSVPQIMQRLRFRNTRTR